MRRLLTALQAGAGVLRGVAAAAVLITALGTAGCTRTAAAPVPPRSPAGVAGFENPIDEQGADPWVVLSQHHYYYVEVRGSGIVVTESPRDDLTDLDSGRSVEIWHAPADGPDCADFWAPELHAVGHRWYVYFAATTCDKDNANHRMFVLESTSDDPMGSYRDRGRIAGAADRWAIDGTRILWKGKAYFAWSGWPPGTADTEQDLYLAEMASPTRLHGKGIRISVPSLAWEQNPRPIEEGPEALVHGGVLRIVYSASGSWTDQYCLGMLTAVGADLTDPKTWRKTPRPVFAGTKEVFGPGHASFVPSPDGRQSWIVYHSARFSGAGWDRTVSAQPFRWRSDGSPDFGRPVAPDTALPLPSGEPRKGASSAP